MRLYEFESKKIFEQVGLNVPLQLAVITNMENLDEIEFKFPVIVKAMVLIGGRGKAGGIKIAHNLNNLKETVNKMLGMEIHSYKVEKILIEEAVDVDKEFYLSVTTDPATFDVVLIVSARGGVDIEEVALTKPEEIWKRKITNNERYLPENIQEEAARFLAEREPKLKKIYSDLKKTIATVYSAFQQIEAKILEINPLILTTKDKLIAADAKIVLDDNSLYRQVPLLTLIGIDPHTKRHDISEQTKFEARAYKLGFPYVDLLKNPERFNKDKKVLYVGLVPGGAGYGIFSIDEVVNIGNRYFDGKIVPVNFMDSGGGPSLNKVAEMFHLLMDHPVPDLIITSRFGGISSCDIFIQGLVMALRDRFSTNKRMIPVYGRMVGTDLAAAREFLEKAKRETPEPLRDLHIVVGNQKIMAEVIKEGIELGFTIKRKESDRA
ncbi:MAG: ATP-grasp domain-containing protein [Candidatus Heimdallarchaeaceae archaeon]